MPKPVTRSILFVCMGNICRSPAGENIMRKLLQEAGLDDVSCDSAGTIGMHAGSSPDARMAEAGRLRNLPMSGRARQVEAKDLEQFDLVLAMDEDNLAYLQQIAQDPKQRAKVASFCSYCGIDYASEVPDPYYGGSQGFERVLDLLQDGCQTIVQRLGCERSP